MAKKKKTRARKSTGTTKKRTGPKQLTGSKSGRGKEALESPQVPMIFTITSVEQLNAIASSKRQKILAEFIEQAQTTKQVADRLGEPATRLYHHVDALVKHGILVLEREAPKRGTVEKYYRAAGRQFRVDDACLSDSAIQDKHSRFVSEILDTAKFRLLEAISLTAAGEEPLHTAIASSVVSATEDEIEEISQELITNMEENNKEKSTKKKKNGAADYRVVLMIYPDKE